MSEKKMTLNQTWKNCLRMWKWIDKVWEFDGAPVEVLKAVWMDDHGFEATIEEDCFFCEYDVQQGCEIEEDIDRCTYCPGVLVNALFHCTRKSYNYAEQPRKFYKKLLELDAKRKVKK